METSFRFSTQPLLLLARRGDAQAFSRLVDALRPKLERVVRGLTAAAKTYLQNRGIRFNNTAY